MKINRYRIPVEMRFAVRQYLLDAGWSGLVEIECFFDRTPNESDEESVMAFVKKHSPIRPYSLLSLCEDN